MAFISARARFKSPDARRSWLPGVKPLVFAILLAGLCYQVLLPFAMIVWTSLKAVRPGDPGFLTLEFTFANYSRALASQSFWQSAWNTLEFAGAATSIAFVIGATTAWVVERTDMPLRRFVGLMMVARIIIPGILITASWILLASPNIGFFNQLARDVAGLRNPFNIYSFGGMVWVQSIEMAPLAFLLLSASFKSMDPRLEEAAAMAGANTTRALWRIALPLSMPAIAAAFLLIFVTTVETFEAPLLIGTRAKISVFTTEIYQATTQTPVNWGRSAAYSVTLLILSIVLLLAYSTLVRNSRRYQTISGKDFRPRRIELGRWRYAACALSLAVVATTTGAPLAVMIYASLLRTIQGNGVPFLARVSLTNYQQLIESGRVWTSLLNSTLLGVGTATFVVLLVALIAYFIHRTRLPGRKWLEFLAFAPIAIPGVVLGATFVWLYLLIPAPILGTLFIIGLAFVTKYMPFALRFVSNSLLQINPELEEAAEVAGVPFLWTFFRLILPLMKPGLVAAWFWVLVHAYRELTVALLLSRGGNRTAAVVILDLWQEGSFLKLSAFGVILFAILLTIVLLSNALQKRYGLREQY